MNGIVKRIVLALGGNALGQTPQEQIQLVKKTAKSIVDLVEEGYEIVVGHGNGPQIGMINLAMDFASAHGAKTPYMPFPECGAMSQGYIGYHLQQAIQFELKSRKLERQAAQCHYSGSGGQRRQSVSNACKAYWHVLYQTRS